MCTYLEKLKTARTVQRGHPCIFDDTNIRSLFGMLDVTGNGFITFEQYKDGEYNQCHYFYEKTLMKQLMKFWPIDDEEGN